ncbi:MULTISPECIES: DUF305 domain-containing protein [Thermomonosporaceae]|uniref:DUF305 domain-containing protein n=1 Tax=Thermomonosporaceae TaxID=2012 RepID=UPI00255B0B85|nr:MULTISPECIES: DUF305 domain-containing protein [Thermomonosporaceae]MDL4772384.1 DUF305 domain-containing protein [Actinomadura xylanilytica]
MKKRFLVLAATVLIGAAACGGGDGEAGGKPAGHDMPGHDMGGMSAGTAAKGDHNDQDVMFAQMMIPHHRQAVQMSKVVAAGSGDAEVKRLAARIERAQAPEIQTMTGWLKQWGAGERPAAGGQMPGMDHGAGMPGMMSDAQMKKFSGLKGAALDERFLTMMIEHHEGAVTMAGDELSKGANGPAKTLAQAIVTTQRTEIATMRSMLKK